MGFTGVENAFGSIQPCQKWQSGQNLLLLWMSLCYLVVSNINVFKVQLRWTGYFVMAMYPWLTAQYQYLCLNTRYIKIHLTALQCNCLGSELILRVMAMLGLVPIMAYMRLPLTCLKNTPFLWVKNMFIFKFLFICLQLHFLKFGVGIILDYGQHESFPKSFLFKLIQEVAL